MITPSTMAYIAHSAFLSGTITLEEVQGTINTMKQFAKEEEEEKEGTLKINLWAGAYKLLESLVNIKDVEL